MTDLAIKGDYRTHKHIPSRSCYQLIIEVSEEDFPQVCKVLGYPSTATNTYVGIALLDKSIVTKPQINCDTEGEKLRTRAVLLCKDNQFQEYVMNVKKYLNRYNDLEKHSVDYIYEICDIKSRAELATNKDAQEKFRMLLTDFDSWKLEQKYTDNLNRS